MNWWAVCSVSGVFLACGARVSESPTSGVASGGAAAGGAGAAGTNERASEASGGIGAGAAGGGGTDLGGAPNSDGDGSGGVWSNLPSTYANAPDGGTSCTFSHPICDTFDSYVELEGDGGTVLLAYPEDPGCGACRGSHCDLYGFAIAGCGISIYASACAGPGGAPPCIDTVDLGASTTHFVDDTGKKWAFASLDGKVSDWAGLDTSAGFLDIRATFTYGDVGGPQYELPAHVHLCADVRRTLPPC